MEERACREKERVIWRLESNESIIPYTLKYGSNWNGSEVRRSKERLAQAGCEGRA